MALWYYNDQEFSTEADVKKAVAALRDRLENNPTDWVVVKRLTGDKDAGWDIPTDELSDAEINKLDPSHHYSVSSVMGGSSEVGLSAAEAADKVLEYRREYAQLNYVNTIQKQYSPTIDMEKYVK